MVVLISDVTVAARFVQSEANRHAKFSAQLLGVSMSDPPLRCERENMRHGGYQLACHLSVFGDFSAVHLVPIHGRTSVPEIQHFVRAVRQ